jgi:LysM repeat protein
MTPRSWRTFAAPTAFLLVATVAVLIVHGAMHRGHTSTTPTVTSKPAHVVTRARIYVVRAGDTLASIAGKTGIPTSRLLKLNPKLQPTSLFLGEKVRLR